MDACMRRCDALRMASSGLRVSSLLDSFLGEGHVREGGNRPLRPRPPITFCVAVAVWICAVCLTVMRIDAGLIDRGVPEDLRAGEVVFELATDAQQGDFGKSAQAFVRRSDGSRIKVLLSYEGDVLYFARERVVGAARFSELSESSFARYAAEGIACRANASDVRLCAEQGVFGPVVVARRWAAGRLDEIPGTGSALLRALLLGDRSHLEEGGLYDAMKTVGLAHMVAVSGSHLAVVGAFAAAILARAGVPRRACVVALCLMYAAYSVFTGLSAPVIRSAVMAGVAISCVFASRRSSPLAALSVCVCVLIAMDPANALSLSFFLSAASTFGVVVFAGLFASWFRQALGGRADAVSEAFGMTMAANLPIFPVTTSVFARVPLISPIANLLAAPVFSVLLIGGLVALAIAAIVPDAGMFVLQAMCILSGLFCDVAMILSRVPYAAVPCAIGVVEATLITIVAVGAVWAVWPDVSARAMRLLACATAALFIALSLFAPRLSADEIVMLDVGQGDAILVRSQGAALLVDTGNQDSKLSAALARHGVMALDGVVVTHHDDDHCASLSVLDSLISRGGVFLAEPTFSCGCDGCDELISDAQRVAGPHGVSGIAQGEAIKVGRFTCTAVWPKSFCEEGGNADSLCLLVEYDAQGDGLPEACALLTGDAEGDQLEAMVESGLVGHVDVFKAGHHGSKNGVSIEAYAAMSPSVALISAGEDNRYGHPAQEALEALDRAGAEIFRTDTMGDVTCRFSESGIEVFTQKDAMP